MLRLTGNQEFVDSLSRDYTQCQDLAPEDRAILDYAAKLTRKPASMVRTDVETLRQHGFDDPTILAINQVVGYFAYVNRVVKGLGVELEPHIDRFTR